MRRAIAIAVLLALNPGPGAGVALAQYRTPPPNSAARNLPAGWIGLFDGTGHCRYAVPPTWTIDDRYSRNAFAMSPDGSLVVHQGWVLVASWPDFVANALKSLQPGRTLIRSSNELRVEHVTGEADSQRYIALRTGSGACIGTIDVKMSASPATIALAAQIEKTVSVAK